MQLDKRRSSVLARCFSLPVMLSGSRNFSVVSWVAKRR